MNEFYVLTGERLPGRRVEESCPPIIAQKKKGQIYVNSRPVTFLALLTLKRAVCVLACYTIFWLAWTMFYFPSSLAEVMISHIVCSPVTCETASF